MQRTEDAQRVVVDLDLLNLQNLLACTSGVRNAYCLLADRFYKDFDPLNAGLAT